MNGLTIFLLIIIAVITFYFLLRIGVKQKEKQDTKVGIVSETKVTCQACGHIWHYSNRDTLNKVSDALMDLNSVKIFGQDSNSSDFDKCPKCGSRAIRQEKVEYKVEK
jgi:predicted nucleic-acid-binding Zn-ribbon protein